MYFLLNTGRIITETQMEAMYELQYGFCPDKESDEWTRFIDPTKSPTVGLAEVIDKYTISIEQLIKGKCIGEAVRLYRERMIERYGKYSFEKAVNDVMKIEASLEEIKYPFKCGRQTHCKKASCYDCESTVATLWIYPCGSSSYCGKLDCDSCGMYTKPHPSTNVKVNRNCKKEE